MSFSPYRKKFKKCVFGQRITKGITIVSKNIKNENKIIRVKFDVLTRESLKSIKNHGWRVLHLSSDEYRDLQLCAEGKYGELDCIEISDLRDILIPFGGRLSIDVVVLAIPKSRLLAEIFIDLGVPHVVYFDFSDDFYKIYSKIDSVSNTPYEWIYSFCAEFYKHLVKGVTIKEALYKGREELKDTLREINSIVIMRRVNFNQRPTPVARESSRATCENSTKIIWELV